MLTNLPEASFLHDARREPSVTRPSRRHRRGISTLWTVLTLPIVLVMLAFVVNVGNQWIARVELENALESAALAAVKHWGDASGGSTLVPREVGVQYAAANTVRCKPLEIGTNHDAGDGPNENATCILGKSPPTGNLIFGAILTDDPDFPITFDAGEEAGCGPGVVLLDATASGAGNLAQDNAWGVAFQDTDDTPSDLRITKIVINLQAGGGTGVFDFTSAGPTLSDNVAPHAVHDTSGNDQPDIAGFTNPASQITFTPTTGTSPTLTIDFTADGANDDGFAPCDRFRFGARTDDVSQGGGHDDGDGIGRDHVQATITFQQGVTTFDVTVTYFDNTETSNDCIDPALVDGQCGSLVVHPTGIPDLPCPATSAGNNNGQSYVLSRGAGGEAFGVRAQAYAPVPSCIGRLFGINCQPRCVQACVTAMYDCETRRPRLVRVDRFICP